MGVMESTWYLPNEKLQYRNYPEINAVKDSIEDLITYSMRIKDALDYYNDGVLDKIDIDIIALKDNIDKCRSICEVLGNANNICFDLLVELRQLQSIMQTLLYIRNRYGNQYVGTPTNTTEV